MQFLYYYNIHATILHTYIQTCVKTNKRQIKKIEIECVYKKKKDNLITERSKTGNAKRQCTHAPTSVINLLNTNCGGKSNDGNKEINTQTIETERQ